MHAFSSLSQYSCSCCFDSRIIDVVCEFIVWVVRTLCHAPLTRPRSPLTHQMFGEASWVYGQQVSILPRTYLALNLYLELVHQMYGDGVA